MLKLLLNYLSFSCRRPSHPCFYHPLRRGEVTCALCECLLCPECSLAHKSLHFCPTHHKTFIEYQWIKVVSLKSTPDDPEKGVALWKKKKELYQDHNLLLYIDTSYEIDNSSQSIVTILTVFAPKNDTKFVQEAFRDIVP